MHLSLFDFVLWFSTPLVQACVIAAMCRRKLHSLYPWFFGYTLLQVASVIILAFVFHHSYTTYFYSYYVDLGVSILLSFAVIYEVTRANFDPDEQPRRVFKIFCMALLLGGFAILCTTTVISPSGKGPLSDSFFVADRLVRIFQVVLLIGLTLFSTWLRISPRSFSYGVMLGFGLFAFINMLVATAARYYELPDNRLLSRVNSVSYLVASMIWLVYSIYGASDPSGIDYAQFESSLNREFRKWLDHNFKNLRIAWTRVRSLG